MSALTTSACAATSCSAKAAAAPMAATPKEQDERSGQHYDVWPKTAHTSAGSSSPIGLI
ncbi:MAG: hypothetical protein RML56_10635 [Burkholderiales bacterium]|nr:hypothetical protein [Burkholderiales bacterium]